MDKKYIQDLYNQLGGQAKFGSFEDFQRLITTDKNYQKDFHNAFGESTLGSFQDFSSLVSINKTQPVAQKKKFALDSSSEVGSSVSQESKDDFLQKSFPSASFEKDTKGDVNKAAASVERNIPKPYIKEGIGQEQIVDKKQEVFKDEGSLIKQKYKKEQEQGYINDFRNATTLPETYKEEETKNVYDEINEIGFLNGVEQGMKNVWNKVIPYIPGSPSSEKELEQLKFDKNFLPKRKEEYRKQLIGQGYKQSEITDEILTKGAIDLEINSRLEDKKLSLANDYLDSLPSEVKDRLKFNTYNKLSAKNPEVEKKFKYIKGLDLDISKDDERLNELKSLSIDNKGLTESELKEAENLIKSLESKIKYRTEKYLEFDKERSEITTLEEEYDLFKRNYGFTDKTGRLLNAVADFGLGALQLVNMAKGGPMENLTAMQIASLKNEKDKIAEEKLQKQVNEVKNINDFIDYTSSVVTNQAPNIALAYFTGPTAALAGIGASGTGNKYSELITSNAEGKTDYSKLQMYLASGLYGSAEMLESNTLKMIGGGKGIISKALKNEPTRELFKKGLVKNTIEASKNLASNYKGELKEELTTFGAQKLTDIVVLDMESKDVFENAKADIKSIVKDTGVMTVGLNLFPATVSKVAKAFAPKEYTYYLDKNNKYIDELSKILNDVNSSDFSKKEAKDKIDKVISNNEDGLRKIIENTSKLDDKLIDKVIELESTNSNLRNKANQINNDKTLDKNQKALLLEDLKNEYIANESLREGIVSGRKTPFDILPKKEQTKIKEEAASILKQEAINKGTEESKINISEEDINNKAKELYNTLNNKQDAVQEQSTTEIPVQSETGISETVAEGISQPKPEIITEQGTQEEVAQPLRDVESTSEALENIPLEQRNIPLSLYYDAENAQSVAEAYHTAKVDGSNPELISAVENLLTPKAEEAQAQATNEFGIPPAPEGFDIVTEPQTIIEEQVIEPTIVVHGAVNGFGLQYSEGINTEDIVTPKDGRGFLPAEQQKDLNEYKSVIAEDTILDDGNKSLTIITPSSDNFGRSATNTFEFIIPNGNTSTSEGIKSILDEVTKSDLKGKEVINESVNRVKEYINSNKPVKSEPQAGLGANIAEQVGLPPAPEGFDIVTETAPVETIAEVAPEAKTETAPVVEGPIEIQESRVESAKSLVQEAKTKAAKKKAMQDLVREESRLAEMKASEKVKTEIATVVEDLLNLDTKDKDGLNRVLDFLNKIDDSLTLDPNELNDVTRVMAVNTAKIIVKTLKTLVNAGITLKEAIEKVAEIHSITSDKIIDALDIVSKINENKSEGISEMELPGFNDLSSEIDSQIDEGKSVKEVLDYVQSSETYNNATDIQQDLLVRDVRKRFGLSQKSAPSVGKLFGTIKDVKKITMREKDLLVKQLKDKAKASKEAVTSWKIISEQLGKELQELEKGGKITDKQLGFVTRAFSRVNMFSQKSVDSFVSYMTKVFENANYADNLKNAKKLRTEIKKLAKNKDKNADLRTLGSEFANIDPALVENIFDYNETAAKIKEAIEGSSKRRGNLNVADTVNIQETSEYVNKTLEEQQKKIEKQKADELQELLGVDVSELNAEEIIAMLGQEEKIDLSKKDEAILRAAVKKAFDIYSSMIKKSLSTGLDVFTDEEVEYTKEQKKLISEFMKMDTDNMNIKESIAAIDSLINFLVNKSTAKMETVVREYVGEQNAIEVEGSRVAKTPLKKLFSKGLAKFLGEQMTSLPILFEKKFKGFNSAGYVMDKMGLTELINKKSLAQRQANTIVNDYVNMFYEKTANNEKFNTVFNSIERDMASFMMRNIVGTQKQMQGEFDRRKGLIQQSIDALSNGNEREQEKGKVYREVYDKILADSNNSNDVMSKIDDTNLEAIYWWIDKWNSKFDKLSDVAKNVYNKTLNRELNFTPDKYSRMEYDRTDTDLANNESAFINNTDGVLYKREAGVLMDKKPSSTLPQNKKGNPISYIDLSFDKNNANSMYDALVDIETAPAVRQIQSFMDSKSFEKIFGEDSQIFKNRIKLYIQNSRKKTPFSDDELSKTLKSLNKIAAIGASMALAGPTQPFKQVIPVIGNTLVNTGGRLDILNPFNVKFNKWLDEQGYAISNRGVESQAQIDSVNKLIDEAAKSPLGKASKLIEKANKKYLDILLAKPDVYIARASWKAYYEQSLRNQGKFEKEMDYSSHKINKEAADYAQRMVDRQQNISDTDLSGKLFSSKETSSQFLVKTMMPFASFRMNQSSRLAADLTTLGYWNSATVEDRKIAIRSLIGFTVEQVIFKGLSAAIGLGTYWVASQFMGAGDDDDDLKKKRNESIKGAATGAVTDIFSPMPITDRLIQWTAAEGLNFAQDMMDLSDEEKLSLYSPKTQGLLEQLGMFGITGTRALQVAELVGLYATGEYKDNFGNVKTISSENREKMGQLIGPSILTGLGLLPPEVSGLVRNSVKISKKKSPTTEEIKETEDKANSIQEIIDNATSSEEIESAEFMLDRIKNPEKYEAEKEELKNMKKNLLIDDETGTVYDNLTDLKRYNPDLYEKNFGKGSEWYELNKPKKEAEKLFKDKKREEKDEEFGYNPKNKRRKNSDGTYKSSSVRRGFSGSSSSSVGYDSNGLKTTKTTRRGFNN